MLNTKNFIENFGKITFDLKKPTEVNTKENLALFEKLFESYQKAETTERVEIIKYIASNPNYCYTLLFWSNKIFDEKWLKNRLLSMVIREAKPDFRDDIVELNYIWHRLQELNIDRVIYIKNFLKEFPSEFISNFFKNRI